MRHGCALALALLAACKGSSGHKAEPDPGARDGRAAATDAATDAAVPGPDLGFVTGEVVIAEEHDGHVTAKVLGAGGTWKAIEGEGVFPSASRWQGGLLVIVAEGEHETEHVEHLAVVRAGKLERVSVTAQLVRNPVVAGGTLVVETNADGFRELYRVAPDGKATRLTSNREGNFEPSLSPDGTQVAFTSSRDGDAEIYRMHVAGGKATRLTAFHKDDWSPQWSPDGRLLAFLSDREGPPRVYLMAPDGTELSRFTAETDPAAVEDLPRWAPDGKRLAYTRTLDGVQRVIVENRVLTPEDVSDRELAWSPDGAMLAVLRHPVVAGKLGAPALAFVRVSDGQVLATDARVSPFLVRWLP
jgi:dipeptidyl aminopeptidase/acylaminoacyl peptidase